MRAQSEAVAQDHDRRPDRSRAGADLVPRDFSANPAKINCRRCGDVTYVPTWEGWLYLATKLDIASSRVVRSAMAEHLRTSGPPGHRGLHQLIQRLPAAQHARLLVTGPTRRR